MAPNAVTRHHVESHSDARAPGGILVLCAVLAVSLAAVVWPGSKATAATEFPTQNATWRTCGQWPLQVSEDGRFFVQRDGTAFFPIIDTVWMLSYLNQADVDQYLARRPANGFNAVYVSLLGVEKLPDGLNSPNYAGHRPFAGDPGAPDTSRPQAAFFEDFKATLRKLRDHDLTVFLVVGWSAAWQPEFTRPAYRRYVEFVLDRYPVEPRTGDPEQHKVGEKVIAFFAPNPVNEIRFPNPITYDWDELFGVAMSHSYAPLPGHPNHAAFRDGLKALFERFQRGGRLSFDYNVDPGVRLNLYCVVNSSIYDELLEESEDDEEPLQFEGTFHGN